MGFIVSSLIVVFTAIIARLIPQYLHYRRRRMRRLQKHCGGRVAPGFENVQLAFKELFEKGYETEGATFAVYFKGRLVVDLWGGYADWYSARLWKKDTLTCVFSATKGVAALCFALLVDRRLVNYDDLVIQYWPEFGRKGKATVTIKMLLNHEAGLVVLDEDITLAHAKDWRLMGQLFESQTPNWPPGEKSGYHLLTFGWLVDQLLRRIDPKNRSVGQFFREEIAEPFGIDFHIGLPRELEYRVSRLHDAYWYDTAWQLGDMFLLRLVFNMVVSGERSYFNRARKNVPFLMAPPGINVFNNPDNREIEVASANGVGTARGLAKIYSLAAEEGRLFKNRTLLRMLAKPNVVEQVDEALKFPLSRGWGFWHWKKPTGGYQFGHPGFGGQNVKLDLDNDLSYAFLRNYLVPDLGGMTPSLRRLEKELYLSCEKMREQTLLDLQTLDY